MCLGMPPPPTTLPAIRGHRRSPRYAPFTRANYILTEIWSESLMVIDKDLYLARNRLLSQRNSLFSGEILGEAWIRSHPSSTCKQDQNIEENLRKLPNQTKQKNKHKRATHASFFSLNPEVETLALRNRFALKKKKKTKQNKIYKIDKVFSQKTESRSTKQNKKTMRRERNKFQKP